LGNTSKVGLVDRTVVEQVLKEHNFQTGDWSNQQKTAEIGRALNADWIVRGELEKFGSNILLTVQFYDIQTFRFMGGSDLRLANADDAYDKMNPLVDSLIQTISGRGSGDNTGTGTNTTNRNAAAQTPAGMVLVEGDTFQMGTASGGDDDERPVHMVNIKSFYMSKYQVTQREWREIMDTTVRQQRDIANRSWSLPGEGNNYPMYYVRWYEAVEYCNKLSIKEGLTPVYRGSGDNIICDWNANGYRLPTEAEWEFAAKGGNGSPGNYTYSGSNSVDAVAWYDGNSEGTAQSVGTKAANSLGIYDMSGNVWEWCWDWYGNYSSGSQTDPRGPSSGAKRVVRGGGWNHWAAHCRSAQRNCIIPPDRYSDVGFRLVRNAN
jgi:formylglycine-generating enzyme required for sulfatase activity